MVSTDPATRRFFFALLLIAAVFVALVARPVASALFVAAAFAGILAPGHGRLARRLGGRRGLAALIWVAAFVVVGGLVTFGAVGLLLGPLSVALFLALLRMYQRDLQHGTSR